jgi:GTP cyclohydrolase II
MYEFTLRLASFTPPSRRERALLASLEGRPAEISRFLGMLAGTVPVRDYFGAPSMLRALGVRGLHRLLQPRPADRSAA